MWKVSGRVKHNAVISCMLSRYLVCESSVLALLARFRSAPQHMLALRPYPATIRSIPSIARVDDLAVAHVLAR